MPASFRGAACWWHRLRAVLSRSVRADDRAVRGRRAGRHLRRNCLRGSFIVVSCTRIIWNAIRAATLVTYSAWLEAAEPSGSAPSGVSVSGCPCLDGSTTDRGSAVSLQARIDTFRAEYASRWERPLPRSESRRGPDRLRRRRARPIQREESTAGPQVGKRAATAGAPRIGP